MTPGEAGDMSEASLELPGHESATSADFDRLVNWIQSELQLKSTRVSFADGIPPMAHFHGTLDGYEYVVALVPTKLQVEV